jgi:RNA polymerase sigma factor (sigma-70 family)
MRPADSSAHDDLHTTCLRQLVDRLQHGDDAASDELLRRAGARLEQLSRDMLRRFPGVQRYEQTGDVLQGASLRLIRALKEVRPDSTRAFFGLAAEQIRRELLDLARHYFGPLGWGANHDSNVLSPDGQGPLDGLREPACPVEGPEELAQWTEFHETVCRLTDEEREVFDLHYYHGLRPIEIGELLGQGERNVRRRWRHACHRLNSLLQGRPQPMK